MLQISISDLFHQKVPSFYGIALLAKVNNSFANRKIWDQINEFSEQYRLVASMEEIKNNSAIQATRKAYKTLGKDPNRYRPSAEALRRRILRDLPLYQSDALVDIINYVSLVTGYSISGFDADKIVGNSLVLGIGEAEEPYTAIGRGTMNIESLPIYRDALGGIGTPTSDHERTKISSGTNRLLILINGYSGKEGVWEAADMMQALLVEFAQASDFECIILNNKE